MRIVEVRERTWPISRYADPDLPSGGLTTSLVAVITDVETDGRPVVGYGFSSFGRYGQGGLIRERFVPRLLAAPAGALATADGDTIDPIRAWAVMMAGEKPGGHGDRSVAVGTLDMALWDAAAKIAGQPLYEFAAARFGRAVGDGPRVAVYASGGYRYPADDAQHLAAEIDHLLALGYRDLKIKIGDAPLGEDLVRIETAVAQLGGAAGRLAVDAMNRLDRDGALAAAAALAPLGLRWFEDVSDPLDFETQAEIARRYAPPIAAGEALFSLAEARLLHRYGGLRADRDILLFDPVHCYGLVHYARIVDELEAAGWPRTAFWPHGGHLFSLQVAAALGLGGAEMNPLSFQPFGGPADDARIADGQATLPAAPGIGFETRASLIDLFHPIGYQG